MGAVWNPADKDARLVLSNNNKTVARNATTGGSNPIVRGLNPKSSGKWWIEYTVTAADLTAKNLGFGLATAAFTTYFGDGATNYGLYTSGSAAYNGSFPSVTGTLAVGDRIAFAVDFSLAKAWISRNGTWLNGDPVAGTSGQSVNGSAPWYPAASPTSANGMDALTMSSVGAPPTGYSAWDGDGGALSPSAGSQSQSATNPSLAAGAMLSVAGASQGNNATSPMLTARSAVLPDSASQAQNTTQPNLASAGMAAINPAIQGHASTSPTLAARSALAPDSATQLQSATQPTILPSGSVDAASTSQVQTGTSPLLAARSTVAPNSVAHAHLTTSPSISGRGQITPTSATQAHITSTPILIVWASIAPASGINLQVATMPPLFVGIRPIPPAKRTIQSARVARVVFSPRFSRLAA